MAHQGRSLEINEAILLDGVIDVGLERPVMINLDSQSKNDHKVIPDISFSEPKKINKPYRAHLRINPNFNDHEEDNGARSLLNKAFWTGVIVCEAFAEGEEAMFRKEQARLSKETRKQAFGPVLAAMTINMSLMPEIGLKAIYVGVAAQLSGYAYFGRKRRQIRTLRIEDFMTKQLSPRAIELAKKYPVLNQGFSV